MRSENGPRRALEPSQTVLGANVATYTPTMVENERAVDNIEGILDVARLGFAFVGPADAQAAIDAGFQTPRIGGDVSSVRETLGSRLDELGG